MYVSVKDVNIWYYVSSNNLITCSLLLATSGTSRPIRQSRPATDGPRLLEHFKQGAECFVKGRTIHF